MRKTAVRPMEEKVAEIFAGDDAAFADASHNQFSAVVAAGVQQ